MKKERIFIGQIGLFLLCLLWPVCSQAGGSRTMGDFLADFGETYYREGNTQEAIHEFSKALLVDPGNEKAQRYLKELGLDQGLYSGVQSRASQTAGLAEQVQFYRNQIVESELEKIGDKKKARELEQAREENKVGPAAEVSAQLAKEDEKLAAELQKLSDIREKELAFHEAEKDRLEKDLAAKAQELEQPRVEQKVRPTVKVSAQTTKDVKKLEAEFRKLSKIRAKELMAHEKERGRLEKNLAAKARELEKVRARQKVHPPTPGDRGLKSVEEGERDAHEASADVRPFLEEADEQLGGDRGFQVVGLHPGAEVSVQPAKEVEKLQGALGKLSEIREKELATHEEEKDRLKMELQTKARELEQARTVQKKPSVTPVPVPSSAVKSTKVDVESVEEFEKGDVRVIHAPVQEAQQLPAAAKPAVDSLKKDVARQETELRQREKEWQEKNRKLEAALDDQKKQFSARLSAVKTENKRDVRLKNKMDKLVEQRILHEDDFAGLTRQHRQLKKETRRIRDRRDKLFQVVEDYLYLRNDELNDLKNQVIYREMDLAREKHRLVARLDNLMELNVATVKNHRKIDERDVLLERKNKGLESLSGKLKNTQNDLKKKDARLQKQEKQLLNLQKELQNTRAECNASRAVE